MSWLLKGDPYEVQSRALALSEERQGYAYFMEMGLGKSATLLADFLRAKSQDQCDVIVVVAPHSLLGNWAKECVKFPKEPLKVSVWPDRSEADVYILNYEAFAVGGAKGIEFVRDLCETKRVMLSLDESTQIKRHDSGRTKALLSLARSAAFTRLLSGAPMVQGPQDIWSQLKFLGALRHVNYFQFRNRYCRLGGFKGKQIVGVNPERATELSNLIGEVAFRAKKKDWLDIPDKTYYMRPVKLSPAYSSVYKQMASDLMMEIEGKEVSADMAVTLMLKLQQISSGFIIDDTGKAHRIKGPNAKLNELISIIDMELDTKVVIPVYFRESQDILIEALEANNIKYAKLLGGMTKEEIENEKSAFNQDDQVRVAIAQTSSQKYGHTLLGTDTNPCHTTIFFENTFSLDDRLQMEDRNHRIGQRFPVNCIDLSCSPIEDKVVEALQHKQSLAEVIIDAIRTTKV